MATSQSKCWHAFCDFEARLIRPRTFKQLHPSETSDLWVVDRGVPVSEAIWSMRLRGEEIN